MHVSALNRVEIVCMHNNILQKVSRPWWRIMRYAVMGVMLWKDCIMQNYGFVVLQYWINKAKDIVLQFISAFQRSDVIVYIYIILLNSTVGKEASVPLITYVLIDIMAFFLNNKHLFTSMLTVSHFLDHYLENSSQIK